MAGLIQTHRPHLEPADPTSSRVHSRRITGPRRPSEDVQSLLIVIVDGSPHQIPQVRRFLPFVEHDRSRGGEKLLRLNVPGGAAARSTSMRNTVAAICSAVEVFPAALGPSTRTAPIADMRWSSSASTTRDRYLAMLQVYVSLCLKSMVRHLRSLCSAIPSLPNECRRRLETELAKPERAADDWSIPFTGCGRADCA